MALLITRHWKVAEELVTAAPSKLARLQPSSVMHSTAATTEARVLQL